MGRRWRGVVTAVAVPAMFVALLPVEGAAAARAEEAGRSGSALAVSSWSRAEVIAGQAIDTGGQDQVVSLSCGAPGDCAGAGFYTIADQRRQGLLITETDGTWQDAQPVRGLWLLTHHVEPSGLSQVSCASAGNCTAGGAYRDTAGRTQAFVVSERNGSWGRAEEIPTAPQGGWIRAVSCWAAGDCTAAGTWYTSAGTQAFVVGSSDGRWGRAEVVPGTVALGTNATLTYLSCPAAGQCSATGVYGAGLRVFVDSERDYVWGTAEEMPGTARYNGTGFVGAYALSCGSPGNCTAGGYYENSLPSVAVAYLEDQVNGVWQPLEPVPGVPVRKIWEGGMVVSLSCPAAGDCAAGGLFTNYAKNQQALVAEESSGSWGNGRAVPGTIALNQGGAAITNAVSCAARGECAAGGVYTGSGYRIRVFIASEDNGTWAQAEQVPGTAGSRQPYIDAIACPAAGACVAVGDEEPGNGADVFVTSQT
jgi:hypothetical protein